MKTLQEILNQDHAPLKSDGTPDDWSRSFTAIISMNPDAYHEYINTAAGIDTTGEPI